MLIHVRTCTLVCSPINSVATSVLVLDEKGRIYYQRENCKSAKVNFPKSGWYQFVNCTPLQETKLQVNEPKFELPAKERNRNVVMPKIVFNDNFNGPARINTHTGRIELGRPFSELSVPSRLFILLHEVGHFYYSTESYCDAFAYYYFCKLGYNNSQAFYSLSKCLTLHDANLERLKDLHKLIQQNEKK